ncbi:helix-turn-helix domain-containing protein [Streptomyces griseoviridis]|jgi:AcrR family transcriptional regulator|uniref:TetR family transcriptional regulator n=3 Tax=Streptomyces TaxID=1883 RepID=A0A918G5A6_STRGD|nr:MULTISPECIES: TetR/AcrR family transcriptional regulator [Streptomyces]MDP9681623.1 AcrR family transcriptional regulator [Streptomyces griseoviridis]GGS19621.1 TetR family transcriptional regulator [Streptomyces niveoruber]GGS73229.1 TetR family transcriptional regulator [Streptomyces griseoviridis]GGU43500.1 TetR family transcriptional regulator [Streptomyces daghestanicus]GHI34381.1 TetR family transcriptional regulator [Streptomyces daghestanicus]
MSEAATGERRQRADKQRNRTHILEVAERFFAEQGITGSMDAIAKRAGIGPGTLYRHFPNREALLAALLQARDEELEARREAIRGEVTDSRAALAQWLRALGEWVTAFDGLPEPLRAALTGDTSPLALTCQSLITTTEEFLQAAQRDGGAKPWVRGRDLFLSTLATAWASGAVLADASSLDALDSLVRTGWETPEAGDA